MNKRILDNCPVCEPVNNLLDEMIIRGFKVIEMRLEDYHFHQFYFKIEGNLSSVNAINLNGFSQKDNFLICDCHWSAIEVTQRIEIV
jgi:hypothetical protein